MKNFEKYYLYLTVFVMTDELKLEGDYIFIDIPFDGLVITDDYNPVEMFSLEAVEEWRNSNVRRFGDEIIA